MVIAIGAPFGHGEVRQNGFALGGASVPREYGTGPLLVVGVLVLKLLVDRTGGHLLAESTAGDGGCALVSEDGRVALGQWEKVRVFPPEAAYKVEREFRVRLLTFVRLGRSKELLLRAGLAGRLLTAVLAGKDLTFDPFLQPDLVVHLFDLFLFGVRQVGHFAVFALLAELVQALACGTVQPTAGFGRRRRRGLVGH